MTFRAATEPAPDFADAAVRNLPCGSHAATSDKNGAHASYSDLIALKLRLGQLENENLALKAQVNQLIMSLSKTLMRGAVRS